MRTATLLSCALLSVFALGAGDARACGGCFHEPVVDAVVTGHRMAFAVSEGRTVLWDQIQYSGDPDDFGWVLPVAPGATIELSSNAWFESLETVTSTQISPPQLNCISNGSSSGCFSSSDSSAALSSSGVFGGPSVTVLQQQTLGPYEQVTLRSTDAGALRNWLTGHGYAIQPDVDPIIDAYIDEGMDFIALALKSTAPMQPVRVVTPSGNAVLPLRMVMAGTGSSVDVVLYLIGEARLGLKDLTETHIDMSMLSFDFVTQNTNYESLRRDALGENLGASYLTTFASKNPFGRTFPRIFQTSSSATGSSFGGPPSGGASTLGELYFAQGAVDAKQAISGCSLALLGVQSDQLVENEQDAMQFACGDLKDIAAAMVGMHPSRLWLSRLEMTLPRDVLSMDCRVGNAHDQKEVSNDLTATRGTNRPCPQPLFESRVAKERSSTESAVATAFAALGLAGVIRRLRGRRR